MAEKKPLRGIEPAVTHFKFQGSRVAKLNFTHYSTMRRFSYDWPHLLCPLFVFRSTTGAHFLCNVVLGSQHQPSDDMLSYISINPNNLNRPTDCLFQNVLQLIVDTMEGS